MSTVQQASAPEFIGPQCHCDRCVNACKRRPGWFTPQEAKRAIEAGYGARLMRDYWAASHQIDILSPAIVGYQGRIAPFWPDGRCTFLDANDRCEIHNSGFKPIQCRLTKICDEEENAKCPQNLDMKKLWERPEGQEVVKLWEANHEL